MLRKIFIVICILQFSLLTAQEKFSIKSEVYKGSPIIYISSEVAIKFKNLASDAIIERIQEKLHGNIKYRIDSLRWIIFNIPDTIDVLHA